MTDLLLGTWNVANSVPAATAGAAIADVWRAHDRLDMLALQEMRGRRLTGPAGLVVFQPGQSEGEDDNTLMWPAARWEVLDAYALRLSEAGWRSVRGHLVPRRVAPVALVRDPVTGARHAFASVHLPPSLEGTEGPNTEAPVRLSVAAESLRSIGNHAHHLRGAGFQVHVGGDWNVDALRDDGAHDAWPELAVGDLLCSAWRTCGVGDNKATFGDGTRMVDDWRTTAQVRTVTSYDHGPSDHRLVVAGISTD